MPQTIKRGYKTMLDEANAVIETIPAADAVQRFPQGGSNIQDIVIVDLRDPREIEREGRIPGAFSCPRGMLEFWIDPASPYAKPIFQEDKKFVFHCASGWRSALAAKVAQEMGMTAGRAYRRRLYRVARGGRCDRKGRAEEGRRREVAGTEEVG